MHFYFNPFSARRRFYDAPLYFNAHVFMYTYFRCARNRYIMQINFAEGKQLQQQNMLNVHHMHNLVCEVFRWNYEQHLYTHTFIPLLTDLRACMYL